MNTLPGPSQPAVTAWIETLDRQIANLTLRRDGLVTVLATLADDHDIMAPKSTGGGVTAMTPPPKKATTPKRVITPKVDMVEVARVYVTAVAAGKAPVQALVDRFHVPHSTARNWPPKCRKLGLLPARNEPVVHTEAPQQFVIHNGAR